MQSAAVTIPGYTLIRRLDDSGAQASVHLGRCDTSPYQEVAVKIYHATLRSTRDRGRFYREIEALERLSGDPHIVEVIGSGVLDNGQPYLAMRLCPGGSLAALLTERGPLSAAAVADLGVTLAETLGRAHRVGVLHRDLKPHNILLADDGSPVLADFGIVALRHSDMSQSATMGRWTAPYAAPELFRDQPATPQTDIYGLAATLYALLSGVAPHHDKWRSPSPAELLWRRTQPPAPIEGVPPALMAVLTQGLSPEPDQRFATAGAFAAALRESMDTQTPPPQPKPEPKPEPPRQRRHRTPTVAGGRSDPLSGVDPKRPVELTPGPLLPLLGVVAIGGLGVTLIAAALAPAIAAIAWMLTVGLFTAAIAGGHTRTSIGFFAANWFVAIALAVYAYAAVSPLGSFAWLVAACTVSVLAGVWGWSSQAIRLWLFARRERVRERRWWGQASTREELTAVEAVPAARFLRLAHSSCHYAVTSGRSVALVRWASWPEGRYTITDKAVHLDGKVWTVGSQDITRARNGIELLNKSGVDSDVRRCVFLAVDSPGDLPLRELAHATIVCPTGELASQLAKWLAADPYTVDLELLAALVPNAER